MAAGRPVPLLLKRDRASLATKVPVEGTRPLPPCYSYDNPVVKAITGGHGPRYARRAKQQGAIPKAAARNERHGGQGALEMSHDRTPWSKRTVCARYVQVWTSTSCEGRHREETGRLWQSFVARLALHCVWEIATAQ